jgi:hypothetical protein
LLQVEAVIVKLELAVSIAAVCLGGSTVLATVVIVVKYRLVYQLISKSQAYRHDYSVGRSQAYRRDSC